MPTALPGKSFDSSLVAFGAGFKAAWSSVFAYVLFGTYIGIGALAHNFGFSIVWMTLSTVLVWAAPAQVIVISAVAAGSSPFEVALAVTLSAVRLLPMTVTLLPLLRDKDTPIHHVLIPTHFVSISMWVESQRLLPHLPRESRIPFCNGLSFGYMSSAIASGAIGFHLAAELPVIFSAALLFLPPMSFLLSVSRNSRMLVERLAFAFGLVIGPLLVAYKVNLDLMWTGAIGGTLAYVIHRLREAMA